MFLTSFKYMLKKDGTFEKQLMELDSSNKNMIKSGIFTELGKSVGKIKNLHK